jgi:hypothetical protein
VSLYASVAQLVEQRTENPRVVGSIPTGGTRSPRSFIFAGTPEKQLFLFRRIEYAGIAHLAERHLAKVEVASSNLVARSISPRSIASRGNPKNKIGHHSQVVRQWTANPRVPGPNPGGASKINGRLFIRTTVFLRCGAHKKALRRIYVSEGPNFLAGTGRSSKPHPVRRKRGPCKMKDFTRSGGTPERMRFRVCPEANDTELVPTNRPAMGGPDGEKLIHFPPSL